MIGFKHLQQIGPTCGQTCLAMISGKTVEEVYEMVNNSSEGMTTGELHHWANELGIRIKAVTVTSPWPGPVPLNCLVLLKKHVIVRFNGIYYDPNKTRPFKNRPFEIERILEFD